MATVASAVLVVVGAGVVGIAAMVEGGGAPASRIVTAPDPAASADAGTAANMGAGAATGTEANTGTAAETDAADMDAGTATKINTGAVPGAARVPVVKKPAADKPHSTLANGHKEDRGRPVRPPTATVPSSASASVPVAAGPARPARTTRIEIETREIPYETRTVRDSSLPRGTKQVETPGVKGLETLRYLVTLTDGRPTGRKLIATVVTRRPQPQVIALGTRIPAPDTQTPVRNCDVILNVCLPMGGNPGCPGGGAREEDELIPLPDVVLDIRDLGYFEGLSC